MDNTQTVRRARSSLLWSATGCAAVFFGVGGVGGLWSQPEARESGLALLISAFVALLAIFGVVSFVRVRARQRLEAVVEAYADREIARTRPLELRKTEPRPAPTVGW